MKYGLLSAAIASMLTASTLAVPAPEPVQVTLSVNLEDHVGNAKSNDINRPGNPADQQLLHEYPDVLVVFRGATPEAAYNVTAKVQPPTEFTIDNSLSVSQITLLGFAKCFIYGKGGLVAFLDGTKSDPVTVAVGPPQAIVSGACGAAAALTNDL